MKATRTSGKQVEAASETASNIPVDDEIDAPLHAWFSAQGWTPAPFQRDVWRRYLDGESGLLVTPTGSGKTLAAFGGPLLEGVRDAAAAATLPSPTRSRRGKSATPKLKWLWITPLRALAIDTVRALQVPIDALGLDWTVAMRTGDATARDKRLARQGQADVLVITPESLALLFSYPETAALLGDIRGIFVDEWHELLDNKRGVLLQLTLARLRGLSPRARLWGMSATLGNLQQARDVLLPHRPQAAIVDAAPPRQVVIETVLPEAGERFPWAGHLGLSQLQRVTEHVNAARSTLLFTNTRSQAELWHKALSATWLDAPDTLALHHGSLDPALRAHAEQGLRDGSVRCVVATSSLDLGVDFPAVDQVIQIGSPKGVARLLQRAGRAKHRPGESGHVLCVPTHALETMEYAAARQSIAQGRIEGRTPPRLSLDVLAQHCVTLAVGGGFDADALLAEVRGTHAFASLRDDHWQAVLQFIVQGGRALAHYPDFQRVVRDADGMHRVHDKKIVQRHRLSIGTITSDGSMAVRLLKGGGLGSVEESFISRMKPGTRFQFAGRTLELVRVRDMVAYVRIAKRQDGLVPRWAGSRMALSSELGRQVEALFATPVDVPEMRVIAPLLALQSRLSVLPGPDRLLVETAKTRDGWHVFVYPFAGRTVHEGLAALIAARWARRVPLSITYAVNDYGLILSLPESRSIDVDLLRALLSAEDLLDDVLAGMNMAEMARRQFRDIARIAGLLPPSLPGRARRTTRQLQASSGLIFDVLERHDAEHVLLDQARREVLESQLDVAALAQVLQDCTRRTLCLQHPRSLTPLSFPLWAEFARGQLSTEDWKTRVTRAAQRLEKAYG